MSREKVGIPAAADSVEGDQDEVESDDRLNRFYMRCSAYHVHVCADSGRSRLSQDARLAPDTRSACRRGRARKPQGPPVG